MSDLNRILLVEDKSSLAAMLRETLEAEGLRVETVLSGSEALSRLREGRRYAAVLTDLRLPGADGIAVLREVKQLEAECPVIVMTGYGTVADAVEAMKMGAYDFIQKPIDVDRLILMLRRCAQHRLLRNENVLLKEQVQKRAGFPAIIGEASALRDVQRAVEKVAPTDSTVLLTGESGTGKELFARAIHQLSPRTNRPFVAINCAAIPDTLLENELFGHERGAYTGASSRQIGKFELADSGTIFLDEIGELGFGVQSKILRVLQEHRFERIGGTATLEVDIRVICATNRELTVAVQQKQFREDLFFRINVFPVHIPPLRARRADIPLLTDHFLIKLAKEMSRAAVTITDEARSMLQGYPWPGNVRELENCIERAMILCESSNITASDLRLGPLPPARGGLGEMLDLSGSLAEATERAVVEVEKVKIVEALEASSNRENAATLLGLTVRSLNSKIKEYGLVEKEG